MICARCVATADQDPFERPKKRHCKKGGKAAPGCTCQCKVPEDHSAHYEQVGASTEG